MNLMPLLLGGLLLAGTVQAEDKACVDVQVGQARALAYDCLTRQLQNSDGQKAAQANRKAQQFDVTRQPPNRLGLFNQSATSVRMGNTFGTSALPQRPGTP
ncbi:hypothetical protein [Pseudomonas sp. UFMG81]|jgi:hypothetical protein|uniref:hypothetical protein n=1 Tax=Pseudomonas sp. UFMG81 TaxID=2745936 RepID=UPI00188E42AD|nr:hypothetical protein [Pseudomonas sp. UFMG81]